MSIQPAHLKNLKRWLSDDLIDEDRTPKGELGRGDRKSLQTDRVVLTAGPPEEIKHVHNIYLMFVEEGKSEREIAMAPISEES